MLNDNAWGTIFPETTSLFVDCLKFVAQFSNNNKRKYKDLMFLLTEEENNAQLQEPGPGDSSSPVPITFVLRVLLECSALQCLTFDSIMCCHT